MTYGKDYGFVSFMTIQDNISSIAGLNKPFTQTSPRLFDRPPNVRMGCQRFHPPADRMNRTFRCMRIFGSKECPQAGEVTQRGGRPNDPRHVSPVRLRRLTVLTLLQALEPHISLFC